jgi:G3E family GTPase
VVEPGRPSRRRAAPITGVDIRFSCDEAHDPAVGSWLLEEFRPLDWDRLSPRLGEVIARHGDKLLRVKGVIWTLGDSRPLVVHGVQRMFHPPARLDRWTGPPTTSIVIIGDRGSAPAVKSIADALAEAASQPVGSQCRESAVAEANERLT